MTEIGITILYALSLLLPFTGLMLAYFRSRKVLAGYEHSDKMEAIISAKYSQREKELKNRKDALVRGTDPVEYQKKLTDIHEQLSSISKDRAAEFKTHGVDALTYARFDELIRPAVRDRPKERFHLAKREIVFVGSGIILGTAASIWSVWV